jgi:hypothetical protein
MNWMVIWRLRWQSNLEANSQGLEEETKDNHENGREYVEITQTPYRNQMLNKQVLKT